MTDMTPNVHLTDAEELAADEAAEVAATGLEVADGDSDEADGKGAKKNKLPEIPISQIPTLNGPEDWVRVLVAHRQWKEAVLDPKVEVAVGRANLQGLDLTAYDFRNVDLSGANLSGAIMAGCDMTSVNLSAANLTNACLRAACLAGAKLRGARIDGADLRGADLTGAHLAGIDLSRAITKSDEPAEIPATPPQAEPDAGAAC